MCPPSESDASPHDRLTPIASDRVPACWLLRDRELTLGRTPRLMGILNVTPDSFSDGGRFVGVDSAIAHAEKLIADGADIIDVGGESTRPYAVPVHVREELQRVVPIVAALSNRFDVPVSIDTSKAEVARAAIENGAQIINDVTALSGDPQMAQTALSSQAAVCVMHMQGTPQTMQDAPRYRHVVTDIRAYLADRRQELITGGFDARRICVDPGIGFGKTHQHNVQLLASIAQFLEIGAPVLVGPSRKGFIGKLLGEKSRDRDAATVGIAIHLARQGVQIIRVHNVAYVRDAIRLFDAIGGLGALTLTP